MAEAEPVIWAFWGGGRQLERKEMAIGAKRIGARYAAAILVITAAACGYGAEAPAQAERLKEIAATQTEERLVQALQSVLREPTQAHAYMEAIERAYNLGDRQLAFELIGIGETFSAPRERHTFLRMRRAIWRHEADVQSLEESYRRPLEDAIAQPDAPFPEDLAGDPVMFRRLLPRCMAAYAANPGHAPMFEFLRRSLAQPADHDSHEQVLRLRLGVVPGDEAVLGELASMLQRAGRHETILRLADELDPHATNTLTYRLFRGEALAAADRRDQAVAAADALARETAETGHYWDRIARIYLACGQKEKAIGLARQRAAPGDHAAAKLLAACDDIDGVRTVAAQAIERGAPAWVLMECRQACLAVGDKTLAEKVFDAAESAAVERVRRSPNPAFDFPYEIRYRYEQEGRMARLAAALLPLYPEEKRAAFLANFAAGLTGDKLPQGIAILETYRDAYGKAPEFQRTYEAMQRAVEAARQRPLGAALGVAPAPADSPQPEQLAVSVAAWRAIVTDNPKDGPAHAQLGLRLIRSGDIAAGRAEVRRAVALGADFALVPPLRFLPGCHGQAQAGPTYWEIRDTYLGGGHKDELEADMAPLLSRTPAHRAAHLESLASWLEAQGRKSEADDAMKEARRVNPCIGTHVRW